MREIGRLSPEEYEIFHLQGYLVINSFASHEEMQALRNRMDQLLDEFDYTSTGIFSTKNQQKLTDEYFYESADKISVFFEEKAFDNDGKLITPRKFSVNKVGHALHELDTVYKTFSSSMRVTNLLLSLGYRRPTITQSMYIFKQPGIGGEVVPHQDNSFLYTEPPSCTGLWLALDDARVENGCLWAIPGSHKNGLARRFMRGENGVFFDQPSPTYDEKDFVCIEVSKGSLVVIHGNLVHQSFENQSLDPRHAYSFHAVETDGCKWAGDNWIRRKHDPTPLFQLS